MKRRRLVAWVEVESPEMRQFRHAASGMSVEAILAEHRRGRVWALNGERIPGSWERGFTFWCPADRPATGRGAVELHVSPVYSIARVPEDAQCDRCGIGIHELQADLARALA